ncbi:MAG: PLDc N-terminal domain-containing protein, partial [Gemmatimonadetes bacterium]|nr:PLDc N-terminal domain-containing protein [Gemmatimonadota bacterium]
MFELLFDVWPYAIGTLAVLLALGTSAHIVLYKRDARAAVGWVGMVMVFPIAGAVLYVLLGVNRIRRLATELRQERLRLEANTAELQVQRHSIEQVLPAEDTHLTALGRLVD